MLRAASNMVRLSQSKAFWGGVGLEIHSDF